MPADALEQWLAERRAGGPVRATDGPARLVVVES
jgi:hypothetical protein